MAEDIRRWGQRARWVVAKLEHDWDDIDEMMRRMVADGMLAMRYGQFGNNNIPDPTSQAAFTSIRIVDEYGYERDVIVWRDHRPEDDLAGQQEDKLLVEQALERMDIRRRRYMSANLDVWLRADPTDFCRPHWFFMHTDKDLQKVIPRRRVGDLCKECNDFRVANGRAPEPLEAEHYSKYAKWPHRLIDPKERRAV